MYIGLAGDLLSAGLAASVVTPCMIIIDKAVVSNASGKEALWSSIRNSLASLVRRPASVFPGPAPTLSMFAIYFGTFGVANACETLFSTWQERNDMAKLCAVTGVNIGTTLVKEGVFARAFGNNAAAAVPMRSFAIWSSRDVLSMYCAFILPPIIAPVIQEYSQGQLSRESSLFAAQLATPVLSQVVTTPLHLVGLNCYNHPSAGLGQHALFLRAEVGKTIAARMMRFSLAYGLGQQVNRKTRENITSKLNAMQSSPRNSGPTLPKMFQLQRKFPKSFHLDDMTILHHQAS